MTKRASKFNQIMRSTPGGAHPSGAPFQQVTVHSMDNSCLQTLDYPGPNAIKLFYAKCCYAQNLYAQSHYADCSNAVCHYAEGRYAEYQYEVS
jgi:hypothetical protein